MSIEFDPNQGLIIVEAEIEGPNSSAILRLALDTGATGTLINTALLVALGYKPGLAKTHVHVTTGSGVEFVPRIDLSKITALGRDKSSFPVLCHTLPPSATIDGLLGLDFLRGSVLTINLVAGSITLAL